MLEHLASAFDNSSLKLIILPTEQCNFRCTYCYEDFKEKSMSPAVLRALKRFLERRAPDLERLQIEWFGGEPLLAQPHIQNISDHIHLLQRRHSFVYGGAMTTNAYLLDVPTMSRLLAGGISEFQVSLDGFGDVHDRTRLKADGRGTFSRIWDNLLSLRKTSLDFHITLRLHITAANLGEFPSFLRELSFAFPDDPRFVVFFKNIERLGGPNDFNFQHLSHLEASEAIRSLRKSMPHELHAVENGSSICYASRANSWVIRSNGSLAKCTVAFADPLNQVGRLTDDGTVEMFQGRLNPWLQGWTSMDAEYLACPYAGMQSAIASRTQAANFFPILTQ